MKNVRNDGHSSKNITAEKDVIEREELKSGYCMMQ